jgi:lipopolysaccharide export system protein LptA
MRADPPPGAWRSCHWVPTLALLAALLPAGPVAVAQEAAQPAAAGGRDPPIDITADRLVLEQNQQMATFNGNVDAVQGETRLRTDLLRVFYTSSEERQATGNQQSIKRLEAEGHVVITKPGEIATGNTGDYDLTTRKMVLRGDVVLTRGENVVRGDRLDVDLDTSISTVTADATPGGQGSKRVRALFVPEKKKAP